MNYGIFWRLWGKLELDKEGYLVNKQYKTAYYLNNNRLVSLKIHKTGAYLKLLHDNVFFDEYSKDIYLFQDGNFKELKENISGGVLRLLDDGSFYSDNLNGIFIFDEEKNEFFPTFIPDDTKESAHYLEDNGEIYLVGDISNRKFPIENNFQ